ETKDRDILQRRKRDRRALLATLFLSRGTLMLTAGDELGRTQKGNNNAYCQDNDITFIDWTTADVSLADFVTTLSAIRRRFALLRQNEFLTGRSPKSGGPPDVQWLHASGRHMRDEDWCVADTFGMMLSSPDKDGLHDSFCVIVNRSPAPVRFMLADDEPNAWTCVLDSSVDQVEGSANKDAATLLVGPRSIAAFTRA
ncbi:MAG: hypothetical protein JO137_02355, partial [Hyphomicrobiales bacterium]|nr:hypothetical protein [Hyphomicrobiales bacterium]